ncbi:MAG: cysteine--tRNA ligase [Paracoccaceae bacterium]
MTEIRLHNSATRQKEVFTPIDERDVRMYVCGPTVYDRAHIGNARPAVVFDVLYRLLRHEYGEDHVKYVRNITDIDDKINNRAKETALPGETPEDAIRRITNETAGWYRDDMAALGCLAPTEQPRATEFVPEMVKMIEGLIAKGHAYAAEGHVLFEVSTYPEYGRLSGRSTDDMIAGARVEVAPYKRDPMDFVLWKPSEPDQPGWSSPWGRGRPGWHIECSAMASKLLGENFDIHGGGADLMFPHHENEIAQSCCAAPGAGFAKVWMHNGMIRVDGRKMSKSLGNFLTVDDLRGQASGEVLRLAMLMTHYRKTLDWTKDRLHEATMRLSNWSEALDGIPTLIKARSEAGANLRVSGEAVASLSDDLNTKRFLDHCDNLLIGNDDNSLVQLYLDLQLIGFDAQKMKDAIIPLAGMGTSQPGVSSPEIVSMVSYWIEERQKARLAADWARADAIRKGLDDAGVVVIDQKGRPSDWRLGPDFDAAKLEAL